MTIQNGKIKKRPPMGPLLALLGVFCACVSLSACLNLSQPARRVDLYTLEYAPPEISAGRPADAWIRLQRFYSPPQNDSTRIYYRSAKFQRNPYEYHRWRTHPGDMVTYFLARDMRHCGLFGGIFVGSTRAAAPYRLEGAVDEIFEDDAEQQSAAVLAVTVTLLADDTEAANGRLLLQKTYRVREPFSGRGAQALAGAMSRAMAAISSRIIVDVHGKLAPLSTGEK